LRRTFQPLIVLPLVTLKIAITADNAYYLYVNGKLVGTGLDWTSPAGWTVNNVPGNVPIAVAIVGGSPACLLYPLALNDLGSGELRRTDKYADG
jgi:hypothetical protein